MSVPHSERNPSTKQDLFRFVHIKEPQVVFNQESGPQPFYAHFDGQSSHFLSDINGLADPIAIKAGLDAAMETFTPMKSIDDLESVSKTLFIFSNWLFKNRKNLKYDDLEANTVLADLPTEAMLRHYWDNLFYQMLTNDNVVIKNGCLRLLQASNLRLALKEYTAERNGSEEYTSSVKKQFERAAKATILIPKVIVNYNTPNTSLESSVSKGSAAILISVKRATLKLQLKEYKEAISELEHAEALYRSDYNDAYDIALKTNEAEIEAAFEAAKVVDPDTGGITYPDVELPELDFEFDTIFENNFLDDKVSTRTLDIVNRLKTDRDTETADVISKINESLISTYKKFNSYVKPKTKQVTINGAQFEINPLPSIGHYVISTNKLAAENLFSLFVSVYNPDTNASINAVELTVEGQSSESFDSYHYENNIHTFELFKEGIELTNDSFEVSGNIVSSKDGEIPISTESVAKRSPRAKPNQSQLDYQKPFDGEPGITTPLYGVKKLEIAEFKRVEQELCCYVEGEVSHIENILAREYKERSTRNLTRTEVITESTAEREVENLSDTSTTDRLELQSEVTNVLEEAKERSFGGSIGSNFGKGSTEKKGFHFDVNLNAYFDGTNSSSESTTFNESESAAREVVSRALHRVVAKTSEKRTSRMMREFEENNKHGFDNRKGDQHVTGIYRWVDKIYKNYLVNYGKRLVYEFNIPEPSRTWKEMIGTKQTQVAERPTAPKTLEEFGINSAIDVAEFNYPIIAGEYGIELDRMPIRNINLGVEMAELPAESGQIDPDHNSANVSTHKASIEVPEGYQAVGFTTTGRHVYHGQHDTGARTVVTVGDKSRKFYTTGGGAPLNNPSSGSYDIEFEHPLTSKVPISVYTRDIVEFGLNVVVTCQLTDSQVWAWRDTTYMKLKAAYLIQYQTYVDKLAQWEAEQQQTPALVENGSGNPLANRVIEQTELKRSAIRLMMNQAPISASNGHYVNAGLCNDLSNILPTPLLDEHARYIRFFERAFDWSLMDYNFHPYFYSSSCNWPLLLKNKVGGDILFEAFLQSGMATMKLPVKAGYERTVLFFLDTGLVIDKEEYVSIEREDKLYESVLTSLRMDEHPACCDCNDTADEDENCCGSEDDSCIEAKWTSRIPTSLTIVQNYSRPLKDNGLPCYNSDSPRIQFCEDGTPVGADEPGEGEEPTVGLMEGFEDPNTPDSPVE